MLVLFLRLLDQGQGRYKVKCEKFWRSNVKHFGSPYLSMYTGSEVETLVGRVQGDAENAPCLHSKNVCFFCGWTWITFYNSSKTALWSIVATTSKHLTEDARKCSAAKALLRTQVMKESAFAIKWPRKMPQNCMMQKLLLQFYSYLYCIKTDKPYRAKQ